MVHRIDRNGDFSQIDGFYTEHPCTPAIDGYDFHGLLINAPSAVSLADESPLGLAPYLPLCGLCKLPYDYGQLYGDVVPAIAFVAVDRVTAAPHVGRFLRPTERLNPRAPGTPQPGLVVTNYFNPDLFRVLRLPHEPAEYLIYAVLREHRSNILRIEVTP